MTTLDSDVSTAAAPARPVVLCILDGWGESDTRENNAIAMARTPVWDRLMDTCPHARLDASEHEVGLPAGQMGNSEVGHMNIGAGRIVLQDLPRIDDALDRDAIPAMPAFRDFVARLKASGGAAHLMGLMSPGGVHSHQRHFAAMARLIAAEGVPVVVHAFLDGRDTPPKSAGGYLDTFRADIDGADGIAFGVVGGRYWAMDRDKRWERIALAYDALTLAESEFRADDPGAAVEAGYKRGESDEFVKPTVIDGYAGMADGDGVMMINFRADRAREILTALLDPHFDGFARRRVVRFAAAAGMVSYSEALDAFMPALFPPETLTAVLGETVAAAGKTQLRIAETEKYAHVTFFLNGGAEQPFAGEERILVPSPKVATYDLQPEMSAPEVTDKLVAAIESDRFDLIVVNYANTDMVGHTGDLDAAIRAVETVDRCLGRVEKAVAAMGGALLITADHGNAERMRDPATGQAHTAHTGNVVPVVLAGDDCARAALHDGRLADVAPTVLHLMGLPRPAEMTGQCLIEPAAAPARIGERRAAAG
jgi:2,3-bisphosphoglycerate-independent phosphoglycerate mutase